MGWLVSSVTYMQTGFNANARNSEQSFLVTKEMAWSEGPLLVDR